MMTRMDGKHRLAAGVGFTVLAGLLLAAACDAPAPGEADLSTSPEAAPQGRGQANVQQGDVSTGPTFTPYTEAPELTNAEEVRAALERGHPPLLREAGIGGRVLVWFLIDATGKVEKTLLRETSGHEALDQAAIRAASVYRFAPARNQGQPVPVWVALPIVFSTSPS